MTIILRADDFEARISSAGGLLTRLRWSGGGAEVPLLRDAPDDAGALASSCYPLVPFGNRVRDNRFSLGGRDYAFAANTTWDRHYLHGEGWQNPWTVEEATHDRVVLTFSFSGGPGTPYVYDARQTFSVEGGAFALSLSVTHRGNASLPYGLGWHPYFAMTPQTTLRAPAKRFWTEVDEWLPGEAVGFPDDLDFSQPRPLPHRWVNNGFEGWSGTAEINWPERSTRLTLSADPVFQHAFVFVSDESFDAGYQRDYFCFEPMTHLANGHNLPGLGDLKLLESGETLSGSIRLRPQSTA